MTYITIHACYMFLSTQTHWRSPSRASCHKVLPLHCNLGGLSGHLKKGKEWTSYREMEFQTKCTKWTQKNQTKSLWKICPSNFTNEGSGMLGSWKAPSSCTPALTCGSTGPVTVFACDPEEGGLASWKASSQEKAVGTRISVLMPLQPNTGFLSGLQKVLESTSA